MNRPRFIIADEHALVIEGFTRLLEEEFEFAGSATNGMQLVETCARSNPDVVLLEVNLPSMNGFEAASQIRKLMPHVKLIFLTVHRDAEYVRAAFRSGAHGYIVKQCDLAELLTAIREVVKGNCYVTPLLTENLLNCLAKPAGTPERATLTARQREVLQLVAEGQTAKEIAQLLDISHKTVEYHKASIEGRLGLHSTAELIRYAFEQGLVTTAERTCA
ncbi:MAG: response regulator transcription factor [Bryobacteraceae bacterium]